MKKVLKSYKKQIDSRNPLHTFDILIILILLNNSIRS
jgi:hypothetical protein